MNSKKQYIKPQLQVLNIQAATVIATSSDKENTSPNDKPSNSDQLTRRNEIWSGESWFEEE